MSNIISFESDHPFLEIDDLGRMRTVDVKMPHVEPGGKFVINIRTVDENGEKSPWYPYLTISAPPDTTPPEKK